MLTMIMLLALVAIACSKSDKTTLRYNLKEILASTETITLEEMGLKISEVELKYPEDIKLGNIENVYPLDDSYIVQSFEPISQFIRFDKEGNFLNVVTREGKSSNEYTMAARSMISFEGNLRINDVEHEKTFSPEGELIASVETPIHENTNGEAAVVGGGENFSDGEGFVYTAYIVFMGNEPYDFEVHNPEGELIYQKPNHRKYDFNNVFVLYSSPRFFYLHNNDVVFHKQFSDTLYNFEPNTLSLTPRVIFDNPNSPTLDDYANHNLKAKTYVSSLIEYGNYIIMKISDRDESSVYVVDRTTSKSYKADFNLMNSLGKDADYFPRWNMIGFWDESLDDPKPTLIIVE